MYIYRKPYGRTLVKCRGLAGYGRQFSRRSTSEVISLPTHSVLSEESKGEKQSWLGESIVVTIWFRNSFQRTARAYGREVVKAQPTTGVDIHIHGVCCYECSPRDIYSLCKICIIYDNNRREARSRYNVAVGNQEGRTNEHRKHIFPSVFLGFPPS